MLDILYFVIHRHIAVVARWFDTAFAQCFEHGAALFAHMGAGRELTLPQIRLKLGETVLQLVFVDDLVALQIDR